MNAISMATGQVNVPQLPDKVEAFIGLRDEIATTPEGGVVMMILALMAFVRNPEDRYGRDALTAAVDRSRLTPNADGYKAWSLTTRDMEHIKHQLVGKAWALQSYVSGTSPETGYALPQPPYAFQLTRNPYSGTEETGRVKVFVASSGASSPRPVTVVANNHGIWKAIEWSSLTVGVAPPSQGVDDDL